jgi:Tripartite tricarboxylate transporter TctB family
MLTRDRLAGSVLALLGLVMLVECRRLGLPLGSLRTPGPAYMPVVLALLLLVLGVLLVAMGGRSPRPGAAGWSEWRHAVAILATCVFAALALERLGFRLTMVAVLGFLVGVVERKGIVLTAALALALGFGSFYVFDTLLRVPLPRGPGGF